MFITRKEINTLHSNLQQTIDTQKGTTVLIGGEPGLGKTTLLRHFLDNCNSHFSFNVLTATGSCLDMDGVSRSFLPWKEALIELDADKTAGKDAALKKDLKRIGKIVMDETGTNWMSNIPSIGSLTANILKNSKNLTIQEVRSLQTAAGKEGSVKERIKTVVDECAVAWISAIPVVGAISAAVYKTVKTTSEQKNKGLDKPLGNEQSDFFALIENKLRELAEENPVVVFIDDLQWADLTSINLFFYLAKNLQDDPYRILLIGAYRPQDVRDGRVNPATGQRERHPVEEKINNLNRYNACITIPLSYFDAEQIRAYTDERFPNNLLSNAFCAEIAKVSKGNTLFLQELLNNFEEKGWIRQVNDQYQLTTDINYSALPNSIEGVLNERYQRLPEDLREILQIASTQGDDFSVEIISQLLEERIFKMMRKINTLSQEYHIIEKIPKNYQKLTKIYTFIHNLFQKYIYHKMDEGFRTEIHAEIAHVLSETFDEKELQKMANQYHYHFGIGHGIIDIDGRIDSNVVNANIEDVIKYGAYVKQSAERYYKEYNLEESIVQYDRLIQLGKTVGRKNEQIARLELRGLMYKSQILFERGQWNEEKKFREEMLKVAQENGSKVLLIEVYAWLSETKEYAEKALALSKEILYTKELAELTDTYLRGLISMNTTTKEIEKVSLQMALESIELLKEVGEQEDCFLIYSSIISFCIHKQDYQNALKYAHEFYEMAQQLENQEKIAEAYAAFGKVYTRQRKWDLALDYLQKALTVYKNEHNEKGTIETLRKIGESYFDQGNYEVALAYSQKIIDLSENNENRILKVKWNTTEIYKAQKKYDQALQLCFEVLEGLRKHKRILEEWMLKSVMVSLYLQKQVFDKAITLGQEIAHKITTQNSNTPLFKMIKGNFYSHLGDAYGLNGDYVLAIEWHSKLMIMDDFEFEEQAKLKIAYCLFLMENYAESKTECLSFLEREEKDFHHHGQILLALINFAIGEQEQVVSQLFQWMEEAKDRNKKNFHFALFLIKSGKAKVMNGISSTTFLNFEEAEKHRQLAEIVHEHLPPQQSIDYLFLHSVILRYSKYR